MIINPTANKMHSTGHCGMTINRIVISLPIDEHVRLTKGNHIIATNSGASVQSLRTTVTLATVAHR